jgi:hypothetical protein
MATTSRGGARRGAGRKPGQANQKTREIADKAARDGVTPLEVMLTTMTELVNKAQEIKKLGAGPDGKSNVSYIDLMIEAASVAKDAAPYMHPRLQSVEVSGPNGGPISTKNERDLTDDELDAELAKHGLEPRKAAAST